MLARDVSNYSDELTPELLARWQSEGCGLVILQCFPASYPQYAEQRRQMSACATAGMPFDVYIYDYLGDPTWLDAALQGLVGAFWPSQKPRKIWLDEEDVETEAGWSIAERLGALQSSVRRAFEFGYPVGIYTGAWWWVPYTGNSRAFSDLALWAAQYDGIPSTEVFTSFGNWGSCAIKQYAGSQSDGTDLNVLSDAEAAELTGGSDDVDDAERKALQDKIDSLVNSLGYVGGDVLKPLTRSTAGKYVKTAVEQIRGVCDQQGIAHA